MNEGGTGQLTLYSKVKSVPVNWLWYPYIPFGKISVLQADPGTGKSTLMMHIIGAVSRGGLLPNGKRLAPMHVIYQCSEDGLADTIKPRLEAANADCNNVAFLNEDLTLLTLDDEKLRKAMSEFNVKLLVIDPFQAYLGDADLSNANGMRKILRRLGMWASTYDCAVVLVGHLNKRQGSKEMYRGLGSIDVAASARSVLQIDRDDEGVCVLHHVKSSLAAKGNDVFFTIGNNSEIRWLERTEGSQAETAVNATMVPQTKQEEAVELCVSMLKNGPRSAREMTDALEARHLGEKTIKTAKKIAGIKSYRKEGQWYWELPVSGE